jgi:phosphatidylserine/phosphatidylglycerophosphate/cardiolipin synthase-like enzyme
MKASPANAQVSYTYQWTSILLCAVLNFAMSSIAAQPYQVEIPSAHFTDPDLLLTENGDHSLIDIAVGLIDAVPQDAEITLCIFKMNDPKLIGALVRAQERGVHVRIILNDGDTSEETNEASNDVLKDLFDHYYYVENDISGKAIIHNKFILFSAVEQSGEIRRHVVLQTSSNFDERATHRLQDMVVFQDRQIYYGYLDYWYLIMALDRADKLEHYDFYSAESRSGSLQAWFYPKRKDKDEHGGDDVVEALERIDHAASCRIYFAQGKWDEDRLDIVEMLDDLIKEGAQVEIVTSDDNDKDVLEALAKLDARVQILDKNKVHLHTKFFLLEYPEGGRLRQYVFTGSHNLTERSLYKNFEVLLRIPHEKIFSAYLAYFNMLYELE